MLDVITLAVCLKKAGANLADKYSSSSAYAVGDYCIHDGVLYRCKTAVASGGEAWTSGHWEAVRIGDELRKIDHTVGSNAAKDALLECLGKVAWIDGANGDALIAALKSKLYLPEPYQGVEYLQSTGSEYIDSGVYGDLSTSVEITMQRLSAVSVTARIFGDRETSSTTTFANAFFISTRYSPGYFYAGMDKDELRPETVWPRNKFDLKMDSSGVYIDGVLTFSEWRKSRNNSEPEDPSAFTTAHTMGIFNARQNNIWGTGMSAKLYGIVIRKSGVSVFDGIPCYRRSDNEPGLYDIISGTFFGNESGSGAFTVGGDI